VIAQARVLRRSQLEGRLDSCLFRGDRDAVAADAIVVERVGVESESLTFANRAGTGVSACDGGVDAAGEKRAPWCATVFGERVAGRLLDPRLDIRCRTQDRKPLAYAFVQPVAGARWIGVDAGRYTELYEVLADLPVRIAGTRHIDAGRARATFDVTQYDLEGHPLTEGELEAAVAG
jgi:hypothetical protein